MKEYGRMEYGNDGIMELWNYGMMEYWNYGMMEYWDDGILLFNLGKCREVLLFLTHPVSLS